MRVMAVVSALVVGLVVFVLAGLFILPLIPSPTERPESVFELDYWRDNLAGAVLGVAAVYIAHRSMTRYFERKQGEQVAENSRPEDSDE